MTSLESCIRELLYRYDCVVVPGFGGFVCSFSPAKIHPVQHRFYPPGKKISFNQMLQMNDGLIAHHLSRRNKISYEEAMHSVTQEVRHWKEQIGSGVKLNLGKIGSFFNDGYGNLQFHANSEVNYLTDSYGLQVIQSLPVNRESKMHVIHSGGEGQEVLHSDGEMLLWKRIARYSAAAAVLSFMALIGVKFDLITDLKENYFAINPFARQVSSYHPADYSELKENMYVPGNLNGELKVPTDRYSSYSDGNRSFVIKPEEGVLELPEPKNVATTGPYYVVGGCFSIKSNAENLVSDLRELGYRASQPFIHNGLYVVCYDSFPTRLPAREMLSKVRREHNNQAWLLRK